MKKILTIFSIFFYFFNNADAQEFKLEKIVDGLDNPWSLSFVDKENILFTEKPGKLYSLNLKNKKISEIFLFFKLSKYSFPGFSVKSIFSLSTKDKLHGLSKSSTIFSSLNSWALAFLKK